MRIKNLFIVSIVVVISLAPEALAGEARCAHCGCQAPCQKVCKLVIEEKKVEIVCWGCKCEDFCLPKCGEKGCRHCEMVCEDCETKASVEGVCSEPDRFVWFDWTPGDGAKMYTKRKLMKKVITKKIPTYKYVVEDLCAQCAAPSTQTGPDGGSPQSSEQASPSPPASSASKTEGTLR